MSLKTRPIKAPRKDDDGVCISVMRRHTLGNGKTPDHEIGRQMFDEWWKELGAPPKLIGAYYREEISWEEFAEKFRTYLSLPHVEALLRDLIARAHGEAITILCVEDEPECCHRRLIAERCKELDPSLEVFVE